MAPIGLVSVLAPGPASFLVGLPTQERRWTPIRFEARTAEVLPAPIPKRESRTPGCLAALEVDGDDVLDLVVGFPGERGASDGSGTLGFALALSGAESRVLRHHPSACAGFGANVAAVGDVDGEGRDDYLLSTFDVLDHGRVSLHSGATGRVLHTWEADAERTRWQRFGIALCGVDDLDGDGVRDVVIGSTNPFAPGEGGSVWACSGKSGALLWSVER